MWKACWTDELLLPLSLKEMVYMLMSKTLGDTSSHKDFHSLRKWEQGFSRGGGGVGVSVQLEKPKREVITVPQTSCA